MQTVNLLEYLQPNKRRKVNDHVLNLDQFLPGSIIRIKLKNFMSYTLSEFQMSPSMNMIIGPNGTGKSTIVCAICIGLGGKLGFLGKQTMQYGDFVKQGQLTGEVEIELKGKSERVIIRREITAASSKSKWQKNGKESSEKSIREFVASLNIQLDSLCQFLAQDRVAKFADQKQTELLREIERSFEGGELLKHHDELINLSEEKLKIDKEKVDIEGRLSSLIKEKESLSSEVEKFKKYQEKKQDLQMHKKLIPFVKIQDAKETFANAKRERDMKILAYKDFEEQIKPISTLISEFTDGANSLNDEITELEKQELKLSTKIESNVTKCKTLDNDILRLDDSLRRKLTEIVKKSRKLESIRVELDEWVRRKSRYEQDLTPEEIVKLKTIERSKFLDIVNERQNEMSTHKERIRLLKERELKFDQIIFNLLKQLNTDDKLNSLSGFDDYSQQAKTFKLIQYLRRNKEKFEGRLFESAVVSLSVRRGYEIILGNIVSFDSQLAIVTTSETNHRFVTKEIMDGLKLNISFRQISSNFQINKNERLSPEKLKELGFDGYLSDFVSGPPLVVQMLCEQHMIHLIPVATKSLNEDQLNRVQNLNIQAFVSGDQILRNFKSSYGNQGKYSTATFLNTSYKLFGSKGLSEDGKLKIQERIQQEQNNQATVIKEIEEQKKEYESQNEDYKEAQQNFDDVDKFIKSALENRNRFNKLSSKCEQLLVDIQALNDEIQSLSTENQEADIKKDTNKEIQRVVTEKLKILGQTAIILKELQRVREEAIFKKFNKLQHDNKKISIKEIAKDAETRKLQLQQAAEELKISCKQLKHETSRKIRELNDSVNTELTEDERDVLATLAKSYMDNHEFEESKLVLKIDKIRRELNSFSDAEESSITKFARVENNINDIEQRLPDLDSSSLLFATKIDQVKDQWLPKLESLVASISKNFNLNFSKIYPLGEVRLHQDENSYREWKLEILVQFRREGAMTILSGTTQSGGEKSVTTAIFLNSLQGLINSPFRVVDEINQGMDARNERMVHKLIVESACTNSNTSQYFLITPKLLTDLVYHEKMSVHCIMAGKFCPDPLIDEGFLKFGIAANYI